MSDSESAAHVVGDCETAGRKAIAVIGKVANVADASYLFVQCDQHLGPITLLVDNAGIVGKATTVRDLKDDILARTSEVNVYGTWWMCKAAMPHLKKTEGCIVNVTSIAGLRPMGSSLAYGMAKAALNALTEDLAKFHGPVRCNAVAPGLVATPWTSEWGDLHTSIAAISPAGRSATPEDCAMAVMACVTNTYMSGTILKVDGGTTLAL